MLNLADDPITLVLVASIALLLGLLLGIGIASALGLWERRQDHRRGRNELLRVWRNARTRRLNLEVEGELYNTADELSVRQYREILRILDELAPWLGAARVDNRPSVLEKRSEGPTLHVPPFASKSQAKEIPQTAMEQKVEAATPSPPTLPADGAMPSRTVIESPPRWEPAIEKERPRKSGLFGSLSRLLRSGTSKEQETPKSIVEQINEILQEKLKESPLRDMEIHLVELPESGLMVVVGNEKYAGVGEVPDRRARELIQESVKEWEKRQDESIRRY